MKRVIFSILIFSTILITGCDTNESDNLEIYTEQYLNTTETVKINTFKYFQIYLSVKNVVIQYAKIV